MVFLFCFLPFFNVFFSLFWLSFQHSIPFQPMQIRFQTENAFQKKGPVFKEALAAFARARIVSDPNLKPNSRKTWVAEIL